MSRALTLPLRLKILCALIDPELPVYDVGCDHGYLGLWAHRFLKTSTTLIDCQPHILSEFQTRWGAWYPEIQTECVFAEQRHWHSTHGNIVIAGMGPEPIYRIAEKIFEGGVHEESRLIICPEKKPFELLMRLQQLGWEAEPLQISNLNKFVVDPEQTKRNAEAEGLSFQIPLTPTMGGLALVESRRRTRYFFRMRAIHDHAIQAYSKSISPRAMPL